MKNPTWTVFTRALWTDTDLGIELDVSRMGVDGPSMELVRAPMNAALLAMQKLEQGAIGNPDEDRMVGHYWLRAPDLAPEAEISQAIRETLSRIREFAARVHTGDQRPPEGDRFTKFLLIGIGGSALGPQFVSHALSDRNHKLEGFFIDNTDPDGMDQVLDRLDGDLNRTLTIVVSKSGGTRETRNGMLEVKAAYERAGLDFGRQAVAVTGVASALEELAREARFIEVFPMWDWVGGRTSELSAVGLLPAALQGIDVNDLLDGAKEMDKRTRLDRLENNPAALLAASWYTAGNGRGERNMVVLPYKDRLLLLGRYLQQLVMESLGKEKDRAGNVVRQGLAVYGNKGSTDQHAYIQQLRDGPDDFFVTFIEVQKDRRGPSPSVEIDVTAGDYLMGFLLGTRQALSEKGRRSLTLTLAEISPRSLGALIALYERAVGLYAELVDINAYHQPGVEAGKKAAEDVLSLQRRALSVLREPRGRKWRIADLAKELSAGEEMETLFKTLEHAAANCDHGVLVSRGRGPDQHQYYMS